MPEREIQIRDLRHAEKTKDIKPENITPEDVQQYKNTHNLGSSITDDIIKQLIIINRGGAVYGQKNWNDKLNHKDQTTITYEGIRASHDFADELFEEANNSKSKNIYLFIPSPAGRTMETQSVIQDRIEQLSKRDESKQSNVSCCENIQNLSGADIPDKKSIFIFQTQGAKNLGPVNNSTLDSVNKFFQDETISEMFWFAQPDEIEQIKQETISQNQESKKLIADIKSADYQTPPEEAVIRILNFYKTTIELANNIFQDRDIHIICTSHNMILDATTIRLLGKEISAKSVKDLGEKAREPLESSQISISGNKITIKHRENEKNIGLKELDQIITDLEKELEKRKKDWNIK